MLSSSRARSWTHRHRHCRAQGRTQARCFDSRGAQARAARGEDSGSRRTRGRQHHGGAYPGSVPAPRDRIVTPKVKLAAGGPNGRVSALVASGEVEIGLQQVSELMSNPEVEVIGMLPAELQQITIYSAGITTSAREAEAAKALIQVLRAPSAAATYKAKGLDPI